MVAKVMKLIVGCYYKPKPVSGFLLTKVILSALTTGYFV
jgi:hypothetical protein